MPGLAGNDLAAQILKVRPDIPIFLCTGYSEKMTEESAAEVGFQGFFLKPVSMADLSKALKKAIDSYHSIGKAGQLDNTAEGKAKQRTVRVLIVEDDKPLLMVFKNFFRNIYHADVEFVLDGEQALETLQTKPDTFELLITDQNLPGISGLDVAASAIKINPDLSVLLWSGYCDEALQEKAKQAGIQMCMEKPVGYKELVATFDKALKSLFHSDQTHHN